MQLPFVDSNDLAVDDGFLPKPSLALLEKFCHLLDAAVVLVKLFVLSLIFWA